MEVAFTAGIIERIFTMFAVLFHAESELLYSQQQSLNRFSYETLSYKASFHRLFDPYCNYSIKTKEEDNGTRSLRHCY